MSFATWILAAGIASASAASSEIAPPRESSFATVVQPTSTDAGSTTEISVLTYNVRGLPWPVDSGRGAALRAIGQELATMRREGRQPDVVLIQEGFRSEIAQLVRTSGYRFWARGPSRSDRAGAPPEGRPAYPMVRYPLVGEGWGKFTGSGLHVLSDQPILAVRTEPFRACAGLDCLANKGVMLVRVALPGGGGQIDIVNTHLNARTASRTPPARSLRAHNRQTEQLIAFIGREHDPANPLLVGGDFNVKGAPTRYDYAADARPFMVVSEFCDRVEARCDGQAPAAAKPWLRSQDLQGFRAGGEVQVRPSRVETVFSRTQQRRALSDHDGYLVRYELSRPASQQADQAVRVTPTMKKAWGLKVSWRH
jgi:endonuclease/exonuclease/phosphatase family metal-dependent hydrolase